MGTHDAKTYRFADFHLEPAEQLLIRKGESISLKPKAFSTLVYLVEHRGRLVGKSELLEKVWGESFIEESAVSKCIWSVRTALGESSKDNRFIQTIPKKGYRFIADVSISSGNSRDGRDNSPLDEYVSRGESTGGQIARQPDKSDKINRVNVPANASLPAKNATSKGPVLLALITLVCVGAFAGYRYMPSAWSQTGNQMPRIAVLPFKPVIEEDRDRGLEFAIVDSLILMISDSKAFNVRQLSAVRKFADVDEEPIAAGRLLESDYVLASNYQVADGRIRVTSQLFNVHTGETEHTLTSEAEAGNIFAVRDSISNQIGNAVFAKFGKAATNYTARRGTASEEAFHLYHEALYFIDKNTQEGSLRAGDLLGRATDLDPNYAQAWALRAQAHCVYAHQGGGTPAQAFTVAEPMLEKALSIDSNNPVALTVRGTISRDYHWNFNDAYSYLERAIKADPNYNLPHRILAGLYYRDRRFAEAVESQKMAIEINPTIVTDRWFLGNYLVSSGRRGEGISQLNRVAEMDPSYAWVYGSLWEIYHNEGDHAKAYENFIKIKQVIGTSPDMIARYVEAHERAGWAEVLSTDLDLAISKYPKGEFSGREYHIASLAALTGNKDIAFDYLEEGLRYRLLGISFLRVDRKFDNLRGDPRFDDLLRRAGLVNRS